MPAAASGNAPSWPAAALLALAALVPLLWPGDAPFINDEPQLIANALAANAEGRLAPVGLQGTFGLAYRLTFLFDEDPVVVPLAGADDRYRPYRDGFEAAPVVAYLFHPSEPRAKWETTAAQLDAQGVAYRREEISGFTVLVVRR